MDHDQLFKDLLTTFFAEFLELFFPRIAAELDRGSIQFLDKEMFTDVGAGDRHELDLLAKVRLRGQEAFILIHIENQSTFQSDFPKRMFNYFAMLHRKHDLPIYPIALFSYDRPLKPAEDAYSLELFDFAVLRFQFQVIQLNRLNWRDFLTNPNPVASALMSRMKFAAEDRPRVKLECLRMIVTLKLNPARAELIAEFMRSYLTLTATEQIVYDNAANAIQPAEKEIIMAYMSEWEEKGILKGRAEASLRLVLRQLQHRFGQLPLEMSDEVKRLSSEQLEGLAEALLDFKTIADAHVWLANLPSKKI